MLYFNQNDYPHAAEVLKRGLELHQDMPTAAAMLGMSYFQLGEDDKAEPLLRNALKANPNDDRLKSNLTALQNDKRMKMQAYEPEWFQFHLERLPVEMTGGRRVQWQQRR